MGSRNPDVDAWFARYENELEAIVRAWCDARDSG